MEVSFKCQYQANVMNIFDTMSSALVFVIVIIVCKKYRMAY